MIEGDIYQQFGSTLQRHVAHPFDFIRNNNIQ